MEQEIKERDEKYVELDTKFGRLHKRAKQRIQEIQKVIMETGAHCFYFGSYLLCKNRPFFNLWS